MESLLRYMHMHMYVHGSRATLARNLDQFSNSCQVVAPNVTPMPVDGVSATVSGTRAGSPPPGLRELAADPPLSGRRVERQVPARQS